MFWPGSHSAPLLKSPVSLLLRQLRQQEAVPKPRYTHLCTHLYNPMHAYTHPIPAPIRTSPIHTTHTHPAPPLTSCCSTHDCYLGISGLICQQPQSLQAPSCSWNPLPGWDGHWHLGSPHCILAYLAPTFSYEHFKTLPGLLQSAPQPTQPPFLLHRAVLASLYHPLGARQEPQTRKSLAHKRPSRAAELSTVPSAAQSQADVAVVETFMKQLLFRKNPPTGQRPT